MNTIDQNIQVVDGIIGALRSADPYMEHIFLNGGCWNFHCFLKILYPDAQPYISKQKDHVVSKLFGRLFDITGTIPVDKESEYRPFRAKDWGIVKEWSFAKNYLLQITECPHCGEPIIYDCNNEKAKTNLADPLG